MYLFNKSPLQQILEGSHTTRERGVYARSEALAFKKFCDDYLKSPNLPIGELASDEELYLLYRKQVDKINLAKNQALWGNQKIKNE